MKNQNAIAVYFGTKFNKQPLAGAMNKLPNDGGEQMRFHRATCINAKPFQFSTMELALEGYMKAERKPSKKNAMVYQGGKCIGFIKDNAFIALSFGKTQPSKDFKSID